MPNYGPGTEDARGDDGEFAAPGLAGKLLRAAYAGDTKAAIDAVAMGAPLGAVDPKTGLTALHIAVGTNNLALTRELVEGFKAPFMPDAMGRWPSLIAIECEVSDELSDYVVEAEASFLDEGNRKN